MVPFFQIFLWSLKSTSSLILMVWWSIILRLFHEMKSATRHKYYMALSDWGKTILKSTKEVPFDYSFSCCRVLHQRVILLIPAVTALQTIYRIQLNALQAVQMPALHQRWHYDYFQADWTWIFRLCDHFLQFFVD